MRALVGILALLCVVPLASADAVEPSHTGVVLTFESLERANMTATQRWSGADAVAFRASLDRVSGNGDGELDASELAAAGRALEASLEGGPLSGLSMDHAVARVARAGATVSLEPSGDVTALMELSLAFSPSRGGHAISAAPAWPTTFEISPPPGWVVADAPERSVARGESAEWVLLPAGMELFEQTGAGSPRVPMVLLGGSLAALGGVLIARRALAQKQSS